MHMGMSGHLPLSRFAAEFVVHCSGCRYITVLDRNRIIQQCGDMTLGEFAARLRCRQCGSPPKAIANTAKTDVPGSREAHLVPCGDVWRAERR